MSTKIFLVHRETKREFEVLNVDKEAGTITLKGELSTFTEQYNPKQFKALGYDIKQVES